MLGPIGKDKGGLAAILLSRGTPKPSAESPAPKGFKPKAAEEDEGGPSQREVALQAMSSFISSVQGADPEGALKAFLTLQESTAGLDETIEGDVEPGMSDFEQY